MLETSKKVVSFFLVVFMLFTAFPLQGFAEEVQATLNNNARLTGSNYCSTVAAQWAKDHWNDFDSVLLGEGYWYDGGDCANFVSQCLYMGGMDMSGYWNTNGYKAHWSAPYGNEYAGSYVRCRQLYNFLVKMGAQVIKNPSASQVSVGDVILYYNPAVNRFNHSAIVIDIKNGEPVLAAHSVNGIKYRTDNPYQEWHLNFSGEQTYLMKLNGSLCVNYNPRKFDVYTASSGDKKLYADASTSNGYHTTFLSGEYAHVFKKSEDGKWGYTFRYGYWGWVKLSNFTYHTHIESSPVSHIFGDWFVVQAADCKHDGVDKRICKRCGYEETKTTKGGHIIDPRATCLSAGFCKICGEQCEEPLGHDWDEGTVVLKPTCTENGLKKFVCKRDSSHVKTAEVHKLGHDYVATATSPSCTAHGENVFTCQREGCSDTYIVANPSGGWSEWMDRDTDIEKLLTEDKIDTKTQYRYRDKETKTSYETSISGWTRDGGKWVEQSTNSFNYASFPSGFDHGHSIYTDFHKSLDVSNNETETTKRTVKTEWAGYVYWHWMYDTDKATGTEYRAIYNQKATGPLNGFAYKYFGAFKSTKGDYKSSTTYCENLGITNYVIPERTSWNDCQGSTRWFRFDYYKATYTDSKKLFNYYRWSDSWSTWSDTEVSATSDRQVETRTRYRYDLTALGHAWVNDTKVQVCKCGTNESAEYCYAIGQVCSRCGATNPSGTKYAGHNYGPKYEISRENGTVTYREDCQNSNCECYRLSSNTTCNYVVTKTVKATCTTDGYEVLTCSYHGETRNVMTERALGHDVPADTEGVVVKPATCDEDGILRKYCVRYDNGKTCSHYVDTPIKAFGHTMTKYDAISATCTEDGRTEYYECELCHRFFADKNGKTELKQDAWVIKAYGHVPTSTVEWVVVEENGCGKTGWKHKYCDRVVDGKVCDAVIDKEAIPEIAPDIQVVENNEYAAFVDGEWVPTSCEEDGMIWLTCVNCYGTEKAHSRLPGVVLEPINLGRLDHVSSNWIVDEETICIYPGHHHKECTRCGTILEEEIIEAKYTQHLLAEIKYGDGCVDKDCVRCDYFEKGTHKFQRDTSRDVDPTCTEKGLEAYTCSVCGKYDDVELGELGHNHKLSETKAPTCTTAGYDVYICVREARGKVCGDTYETNSVNPLGHDLKKTDASAPFCEKDGNIEYYTCQRTACKKIFENLDAVTEIASKDTVLPQLGHEADNNWVVTKEPTCAEKGEEQCKCVRHDNGATCNKIYTRELEINPEAHKWNDGVVDPSSTCKNHGVKTYTCQNDSSHVKTEEVPLNPDNHVGETYIKDAVAETCTENGYTGDTYCSDCNVKLRDGEVIPACGHDWGEWTKVTEATCEEDGLEKRVCKNDASHVEEKTFAAIGHDWDDGVVLTPATCIEYGTMVFTCKNDNSHKNAKLIIPLDPDNHVGETEIKFAKDATCTEKGYTGDTYCLACNAKIKDGEEIPAHGHDWGEWTTVTQATCEDNGREKRICKADESHVEEKAIEAIGHKWDDGVIDPSSTCKDHGTKTYTCQNDNSHKKTEYVASNPDNHTGETYVLKAKDATCTKDGYTGDTYCSDCNAKIKDGEVIPAHGHDWGEWTTVTEPACEEEGLEQRVCKNDASHIEENELAAIGHKWDDGVIGTAPSCKEKGTKIYTCQNDDSHKKTEKSDLDPDGHYGETYVEDAKDATCTEDGYTGDMYCSDCDEKLKDGEVIPAHDHDWDEWKTTKKPTCGEDGTKERVCKYDGSHTEEGIVPATGHNVVVDSAVEPDCTENGIAAGSHCESCGEVLETQETIPALGHDMGDWYVKTPADYGVAGVEQRDCSRCDYNEKRPIEPLVKNTYIATFVIGEQVIETVVFEENAKYIDEPEMPKKDNYVGYWEDYEIKNENIVINGYYELVNPDNVSDIVPDKDAVYNDGTVKITLSASAETKKVNILSENTTPVDVILVLDQSGSMDEKLGAEKKIDSLVSCASSFVEKIYENAAATGADHRVAVVGFAMGNYTADSRNYPEFMNTAVLTTGGAPVNYLNANESTYANALMSIMGIDGSMNPDVKSVLDRSRFTPKGATAANYGLEMANLIIDNNPLEKGEKRQRIVIFITDGVPTLYTETNRDQVLPVANNAIKMAKDLKESALVYSIGIADGIDPAKEFTAASNGWSDNKIDFNRFLHYVSSNYSDAESMSTGGAGSKDSGFYLAVKDTSKLDSIFKGILYSSVYTVETFDKVTLVDTISADFTFTAEQEEALRNYLITEKGIGSNDVTVTRNADGTTKIVIENVRAEKVYDDEGKSYYKAEVSFEVTANENALEAGEYETNTDDSGVMIDGAYVGKFDVPTIVINERRNIVVFTIDGVVYRIDEGNLGDEIVVPESDLAKWNIPDGAVIEESYTEFNAAEINKAKYKITWIVESEIIETYHVTGSVIEPIDVDAPAGMEFAGWYPALRYTMPATELTYTARFKSAHEHNYVYVSHSGDCENGITVMYECECGETKVEERAANDHNYEAVIIPTESSTISNIICTNQYCSKSQGNQLSYRCSYTLKRGWRTEVIEIDLYEKGVQTQLRNGKIAIMVPLDSDIQSYNFAVTRIDSDNNETAIVSEKKDGYLIFYADHFSIFKITVLDEFGQPSEDLSYSQCICELNGHTTEETVVESTCTGEGYTKYTCSNCGYFYFDNNVAETGHDYNVETVESSCTGSGYVKYECRNCGHTYTEGETEAAGHNYEAVTTAPACTTNGYTTYTCTECGYSYVGDEVDSIGHDYVETVVAPTCIAAGYTTYVCAACGDSYVGNNVAATGHNIKDTVVNPTCIIKGYTLHECADCDYSYIDSTTAETGHNFVKTVVASTCTTTGYTSGVCSYCGATYSGDITPVAAHTPGDWVLSPEGKYVKICSGCKAVVETRVSDIAIDGTVNGKSSMTVYYKMSKLLTVTASAGKIVYSSADPSIATVDENGRVTGVKKGTTTITATIEGTNDSVTCEVTVKYTWWQQFIRMVLLGFLWY